MSEVGAATAKSSHAVGLRAVQSEAGVRTQPQRVMALFDAWRRRFFAGVEAVLFILIVSMLALVVLQVLSRYVFRASLPWTEEVARMLLVWSVMLGAAVAMERNEHYVISVLSSRFRGAWRTSVLIATNIMGLVFLAVLVRYGIEYMRMNMHTVQISTQISRGWTYLALPVGGAIMGLSLISHSIQALFNRSNATDVGEPSTPLV